MNIKQLFFFLLCLTFGGSILTAQTPVGSWEGVLKTKVINLPLLFHVGKDRGQLLVVIDSPEQNSYDIPADSVGFADNVLIIKHSQYNMVYRGKMVHKDTLVGTFTQGPRSKELVLVRVKPKESSFLMGFEEEELLIKNKRTGVKLGATLTYPKEEGPFPSVILISGSGPQDRDATLFGKKLFKTVAEHFTRSGYAVLRFDDRGTAKSTGSFAKATSFDFANDVEGVIAYLKKHKKINKDKIGLMGHSEGSLIASIVGARNSDVDFILSVAGPGIKGDSLILTQSRLIMEGNGMAEETVETTLALNRSIYKVVLSAGDSTSKDQQIRKIVWDMYGGQDSTSDTTLINKTADALTGQANTAWFRDFLAYDPSLYWSKVSCPVFAVNGVKDIQVPPVINLLGIQKNLEKAENYDVKVKMYPGLNHLMIKCETGLPSEYPTLNGTFSGAVLNDMVSWMNDVILL